MVGSALVQEQIGLLVQSGVIGQEQVMRALSAQPMADWATFLPIREHIVQYSTR